MRRAGHRCSNEPRVRSRDRRGKGERGQSLAESAILLPIFLILIVGVIEVTHAMNAYVTVVSSARDGARLGSKGLATDAEIKNLVVVETARLQDPSTTSDVTVTHPTVNGVAAVRVRVCNDHRSILHINLLMPDTFRICSTTAMRKLT